jgi:hypothetical protein
MRNRALPRDWFLSNKGCQLYPNRHWFMCDQLFFIAAFT